MILVSELESLAYYLRICRQCMFVTELNIAEDRISWDTIGGFSYTMKISELIAEKDKFNEEMNQ